MIGVAVSGALGRMGSLVCSTIEDADGLELVAATDVSGPAQIGDTTVDTDPGAAAGADVVVDFTTPAAVMGNLRIWNQHGVHCVVGTSGFDPARIDELRSFWSAPGNCLIVPNFSVGAVLMMRLAEIAAPFYQRAEIVELHHDQKADAPSGTSIATAGRIADARPHRPRSVGSELMAGARGADADGVPIHSVRLGGLVAHQEVLFGGEGETLTIRHDSLDRSSFMPGVMAAVRGVAELDDAVTVGLDSILGV